MVKLKISFDKKSELYSIIIGRRTATWKDFNPKTPFPNTPAVYQRKKEAEKDLKKLRKVL